MKVGIYQILNTENNKRYIGSSKRVTQRFYMHRCKLKQNCHANQRLQNAYNKYGKEKFAYSIVELCDEAELIEKEQKHLDLFSSRDLYNILSKAYSPKGYRHTEEFKEARRAFKHTAEAKEKIRAASLSRVGITTFKKGHVPWSKGKKGLRLSPQTEFKKGDPVWNKGLTGLKPWMKLDGLEKGRGLFKGTKGILKANSGSFKTGLIPWNKPAI